MNDEKNNDNYEIDADVIEFNKSNYIKKSDVPNTLSKGDSITVSYIDDIIEPPSVKSIYYPLKIFNTTYTSGIEIYKRNTTMLGYEFQMVEGLEENEGYEKELEQMKFMIETINPELRIEEVLSNYLDDFISYGYGGVEIVFNTDPTTGFLLVNVPVDTLKFTKQDDEYTEFQNSYMGTKYTDKWRFRRYVQEVDTKKIWYKSLLDPRIVDKDTGEYIEDTNYPIEKRANPLEWLNYGIITNQPYNFPFIYSQYYNIEGSSNAQNLNSTFFQKGMMVDMALMVTGQLTQKAKDELKKMFEESRGIESKGRIIVLTAVQSVIKSDDGGIQQLGNVDMKLEKLPITNETDAQFLEYMKMTNDQVREALLLPKMYFGEEGSYNRATADVIRQNTESLVFQPIRNKIEKVINKIFNYLGYWKYEFRLKKPVYDDPTMTADLLKIFFDTGAISQETIREQWNILRNDDIEIEEEITQQPIEEFELMEDNEERLELLNNHKLSSKLQVYKSKNNGKFYIKL